MGVIGDSTIDDVEQKELPSGVELSDLHAVEDVTQDLRGLFKVYDKFDGEYIVGEVANYSESRGTVYLTLSATGSKSELRCVIWEEDWSNIDVALEKGLIVAAKGELKYYEGGGRPNLNISTLKLVGESAYQHRVRQLRSKLERRGLLDEDAKQSPPLIPDSIGVVTAVGSDAEQDIVESIWDRHPGVSITVFDTAVQGETAHTGIANTIRKADAQDIDTLVISRGGGSDLTLRAFDTEAVVDAVAEADTPTISAIGHDADEPLIDDVADVRVPTPTAVGKAVVLDKEQYAETVNTLREEILQAAENTIDRWHNTVSEDIMLQVANHRNRWIKEQGEAIENNTTRLVGQWLHEHRTVITRASRHQAHSWVSQSRDAISAEAGRLRREREIKLSQQSLEEQNETLKKVVIIFLVLLMLLFIVLTISLI